MVYKSFDEFPTWLKVRIQQVAGERAEFWVNENIPALGNKTVLSVMNSEDGEQRLRAYFRTLDGHFRL